MKKITLLFTFVFVCFFWKTSAQVLNQSANWPNANWTVTGSYNTNPNAFEANPTVSANFAFDDDDAGNGSNDSIAAESPIIDITPAFTAGETYLKISVEYVFLSYSPEEILQFEYYDADAGTWIPWQDDSLPPTQPTEANNYCSNPKVAYTSEILDISAFTATQLSGFRYRIFYDDNPNGSGWYYGFCFSVPTIFSELPPSCLKPTNLMASNITPTSADLSWTENGTATSWDIELGIMDGDGYTPTGFPNFPGVTNPQNISVFSPNTTYTYYVRANCGSGGVSEWEGPYMFKTPCAPSSGSFSESFEIPMSGPLAPCWSIINQGSPTTWNFTNYGSNAYDGSIVAYIGSQTTAHDDYLISPSFSVTENSNRFTFHSKANSEEQFNVLISTSEMDISDFSVLEGPITASGNWEEHSYDLSAHQGQNVYIAIQAISQNQSYLFIDGVVVDAMPTCAKPTDLYITNLSTSGANLNWTENGTASTWDIQFGAEGFTPFGINFPGSTNPQTISSLTPGESYDFYVRANCGSGDVSEWAGPFTFTTLCDPIDNFQENFDGLATGELPECWRSMSSSDFTFIGGYSSALTLQNGNSSDAELFAVMPPLNALASGTNLMRFSAASSLNTNLEIGTMTDPTDPASFTSVRILTANNPGYYEEFIVPFEATSDMFIAFRATFDGINQFTYIENLFWELAPSCIKATGVTAENIAIDSADLSWTENGTATTWEILIAPWGEIPTPTAETTGTLVTDNSYTVTELLPGTYHVFYVRANCGGGDVSEWSDPYTFLTSCPVYSEPFTEGFESSYGSVATCWTTINQGDPNAWNFYISPSNPYDGIYVAGIQTHSTAHDDYLISPQITVTENTNRFSFQASANSPEQFNVLLSTTGNTPSDFSLLDGPITAGTDWEENTYDLSAYEGQTVYVAIQAISQFQSYLYIDGVVVDAMPTCPDPSDLYVTDLMQTSASLGWMENGPASAWDIELVAAGSTATGNPTYEGITANPFPITDLTTNTSYEFYVRANCGTDDVSQWVGPLTFTTLCEASGAFTENFDGTTTGEMPECWFSIVNSTNENTFVYVDSDYGGTSSPNSLYFYSQDMSAELYAITPMLTDLPTGINKLRFQSYSPTTDPNVLEVGTMSDPTDASTFTVVESFMPDQAWEEYEVLFTNTTDDFIAFRATFTNSYYTGILVDDVVWEPLGICPMPIDLTVNSSTTTTADLGWTENGLADTWDIEVVETGVTPTGNPTDEGVTSNPFTVDELTAGTMYDFYVRAACDSENMSEWAGPYSFSTECDTFSLPVCENFDNAPVGSSSTPTVPNCWSFLDNGLGYGYVHEEGYFFLYNSYNGTDYILVSPEIPSLGSGNNWIQFDADANIGYQLIVGTMSDPTDATTFTPIETITLATSNYETHTVLIPSGTDSYIAIKHGNLGAYRSFAIDNICIEPVPVDYVYLNGNWSPMNPNGNANFNDNILIMNGTTSFTADITMNNLTVQTGAILNVEQAITVNGNISNDGAVIFRSDDNMLGQMGNMTGVSISGDGTITVERHIHARDDGKGAYRYLTSAVNSTGSIHDNWQEGASSMGNPNPGYGMHITGTGGATNGFDTTGANATSMFTFDNSGQTYVDLTNTNVNTLIAGQAYTAYVWGDRSVNFDNGNDPTATSTTLRATGDLYVGDKIISNLSQTAGGFSLIGNPYQAIVNMNDVMTSTTNINTGIYYVWDPNLGTRGAYATVDLAGTSTTPSGSEANQYVMPGQAVWVVTASNAAASLTFQETNKAINAEPTDVFRAENTDLAFIELQLFQADRYANGQSLSDAVRVNFSETGDNAVLLNDAPKLSNMDENLARTNGTKLLSVENRAFPLDGEVLPLNNEQYRVSNYVFKALVNNLPAGTTAYLLDNYLGTQTELANNEATPVEFSVDVNISASTASDRFSLMFSKNTMGVDSNLLTDGLSIYPNPVKNGQFFIATSGLSGEKVQVSLYNILGQKVYVSSETVNSDNRMNVPTTSLEAGVYLVEMKHNGKTFTGKVVVE